MKKPWKSGSLRVSIVLCLIALGTLFYYLNLMQVNEQVHNQSAWIIPIISGLAFLWLFGKSISDYYDQEIINTLLGVMEYTEEVDVDYYTYDITNKVRGICSEGTIYLMNEGENLPGKALFSPIKFSSVLTFFYCYNPGKEIEADVYIVRDRSVPLSMGGLKAYRKPIREVSNVQVSA